MSWNENLNRNMVENLMINKSWKQWSILALLIAVYLLLFFFYYPPILGIEDEVGYVNQALVWSKGAVSAEGAGLIHVGDFISYKGLHFPWRDPGRSLLVLPFLIFGGMKSIFGSGAVVHVSTTLVAAILLRFLGASPLWATLILYHPTLAIYSRTIMGDEAAGLSLLLAFYTTIVSPQSGGWVTGLFLGTAVLMRCYTAIVIPFFVITLFRQRGKDQAVQCLLIAGVIASLLIVYNVAVRGNIVSTYKSIGSFGFQFVGSNLTFYFFALLMIYPFMVLSPFLVQHSLKAMIQSICFPLFIVFIFWYFRDQTNSLLRTLVIGQRYLQSVLPIWILCYVIFLRQFCLPLFRKLFSKSVLTGLAIFGCISLVVFQWGMFQQHQAHLKNLDAAAHELSSKVPEGFLVFGNSTIEKLFGVPGIRRSIYYWENIWNLCDPRNSHKELNSSNTWFAAFLSKNAKQSIPPSLLKCIQDSPVVKIPTEHPLLTIYKSDIATKE